MNICFTTVDVLIPVALDVGTTAQRDAFLDCESNIERRCTCSFTAPENPNSPEITASTVA